jgi:hypothetical protein
MSALIVSDHPSCIIRVNCTKLSRDDRPHLYMAGPVASLAVYAKASPTNSSLFFQRAFAFSGSRA